MEVVTASIEKLYDYLVNMEEQAIVLIFAFLNYVIGAIVYVVLLFIPAPYGRYSAEYNSYAIPAKVAWFVQEIPAFVMPVGVLISTQYGWIGPKYNPVQILVLFCYILHYFQRSFIYPFLIVGGKPTTWYAMVLACIFSGVNGYMQSRGAVFFSEYPATTFTFVRLVVGLFLYCIGFLINQHSDHILRNLRKPGETGYKIPQGGIFQYVTCANYFGEIVEWFGFAIASWSIVAFAFAFFTVANLVPRAFNHHRWYLLKFDDYPTDRKAVFPFLL